MTDWLRVFRAVAPHGRSDVIAAMAAHADECFTRDKINTPLRQAHFLAHMAVESTGLTVFEENLSYSAARLCQVWPHRFPSQAQATPYAHNPRALAEKVYGGRMGNRLIGDAFKFRGHGPLQETGHDNTAQLAARFHITVDVLLERLVTPSYMLECATARFVLNGCIAPADEDDIEGSTEAINGGLTGLADRKAALKRVKQALAAARSPVKAAALMSADEDRDEAPDVLSTLSEAEVMALQRRLTKKGYHLGLIDGKPGGALRGALVAFQNDNGLARTSDLDDATRAALASELTPDRPIGAARANATVESLREAGSSTIKAADDAQTNTTVVATGGTLGFGLLTGWLAQFKAVKDQLVDAFGAGAADWLASHALLIAVFILLIVAIYERSVIRSSMKRVRGAVVDGFHNFRITDVKDA